MTIEEEFPFETEATSDLPTTAHGEEADEPPSSPALVVVMGVTGCGKSTVGAVLAQRIGVHFEDGDDYHTPENVEKMRAGTPLDDDDRRPWLYTLSGWLSANDDRGAVLGCSALKRSYRDILRLHSPGLVFLHLVTSPEVITERVGQREGHFMPTSLVESQFATLEPLEEDELGVDVEASLPVERIVDEFVAGLPVAAAAARSR